MPNSDKEALDLFQQEEEEIAALNVEAMAEAAPPFDKPLSSRQYNVTVKMLERVINDLSGGQVEAELPKVSGNVEQLPGEVVLALSALHQFTKDPQFEPGALATNAEAFGNLAGILSSMRSKDGKRPAARPDPTVVTRPELAADDQRAEVGALVDQLV